MPIETNQLFGIHAARRYRGHEAGEIFRHRGIGNVRRFEVEIYLGKPGGVDWERGDENP